MHGGLCVQPARCPLCWGRAKGVRLVAPRSLQAGHLLRPHPQAWYREGRAAEGLKRWEDAATAFYQAAQLQPDNEEFIRLTKEAIVQGRKEYQANQAAQGQQQQAGAAGGSGSGNDGES